MAVVAKDPSSLYSGGSLLGIVSGWDSRGLERRVGDLESLKGAYPSGRDGLEVTKIPVAAHRSVEKGGDLVYLNSL